MKYQCRRCQRIIDSSWCPSCKVEDSTPIEEAPSDGRKGAKRPLSPSSPSEQQEKRQKPEVSVPALSLGSSPSSSYALAHTMGRCRFDPRTGDGAYADWMQRYFSSHLDNEGCVHVDQLRYDRDPSSPVGNILNAKVANELNPEIGKEFDNFLQHPALQKTNTVILNWHIRCTGTNNGWTGRKPNEPLFKSMEKKARARGKTLKVIYTVHEPEGMTKKYLIRPNALVALNPEVEQKLRAELASCTIVDSRVPGYMTSLHTSSVDLIMQYVGDFCNETARDWTGAYMLQTLRLLQSTNSTFEDRRRTKGIIIFGTITSRHGTTVENVTNLCKALANNPAIPNDVKVVIVGKTPNAETELETALRNAVASSSGRLIFHGELGSFNDLAGCRYAISFDSKGFRDNASAMVNVTRAGHLLFSRMHNEDDTSLIRRTVAAIADCERNGTSYINQLAAQHPRFQCTSEVVVGQNLDRFFRLRARL
jgi:hypothetical protein